MSSPPAPHRDVALHPVAARTIATWPAGSFVENIAPTPDGGFVVSIHNQKVLHRVAASGATRLWASMPASPAGLIAAGERVYVVGGEPGQEPQRLYEVAPDGAVTERGIIPGALFLNGFTPGPAGFGYAVDSLLGVVFAINLATGAAEIVLRDENLQKCSLEPMLPGVNGIKAGDGALFLTNTDRALVLKAPLDGAGRPTGALEIVADALRGDDLALDANGALYITNHIHNTLIRLASDGARTAIAGPDQGMAGCTACVFGTAPDDRASLFVTTTGGVVMPYQGVAQEAKLVRLEVGAPGRPLGFL